MKITERHLRPGASFECHMNKNAHYTWTITNIWREFYTGLQIDFDVIYSSGCEWSKRTPHDQATLTHHHFLESLNKYEWKEAY